MRMVPIGEPECYSFNIRSCTWNRLPDLPIGKLHPTLTVINSRFIFQIGGFDDYDFDIYRLDMRYPHKPWKTITLDQKLPIIDETIYFKTQNFLESH